jgi:hypothetical protein
MRPAGSGVPNRVMAACLRLILGRAVYATDCIDCTDEDEEKSVLPVTRRVGYRGCLGCVGPQLWVPGCALGSRGGLRRMGGGNNSPGAK